MAVGYKTTYNGRVIEVDDLLVKRDDFSTGTLWVWGEGSSGKLGTGALTDRSSPVTTSGGSVYWKTAPTNITYFGVGAIKSDGTLWTWGGNTYGSLGSGSTLSRSSPGTTAGGGNNWKQVSFGFHHTAGIKADGTLWTWGINNLGSGGPLGTGNLTDRSSPGTTAGGGTNWKQVSCGYSVTAAVKTDGTLWTWGSGAAGGLGTGSLSGRSSPGTTAGGGTNWKQVAATTAFTTAPRDNTVGAVKTDGTLWMWGAGLNGVLGNSSTLDRSSPVTVSGGGTDWKQIAIMNYSAAAVKIDGTLWTWGLNTYGQLGDGTTTNRSSPGTTAGGGTNWKQVSCGYSYADVTTETIHMAAVKTDSTLWTWGRGTFGRLGTGATADRSSPGTTTGGISNWKEVTAGAAITIGITDLTI